MASNFAYNSVFNVIAGLATTCGGFVSTVVVARSLGVEGTGVIAFAAWIVTVAVAAADIGVPGALARYLPVLRAQHQEASLAGLCRHLLARFLTAIAIVALCFAGYSVIIGLTHPHQSAIEVATFRDAWTFWLLVGLACVTQGLASFANGYLKGRERFGLLAAFALASAMFQITSTIAGTLLLGIAGALLGSIAGSIIPAAVTIAVAARNGPVQPELKRRVNRFAWETWASYLVTAFAWSRLEIFFLERSWGVHAAGVFSVSVTLTNMAAQAPMLMTAALLPYLARHAGSDTRRAHYAYATGVRLMAFVAFPSCIGMAAIAPVLMPLIFGAEFAQGTPVAMVLLTAAGFRAVASVATIYLFAMERTRIVLLTGIVAVLLSIAVGLLAVPQYGPMGAALGRGAIQCLTLAFLIWYINRDLSCGTPLRPLVLVFVCAILCGAAAVTVIWIVPGAAAMPTAIVAGVIVYTLAVKLIRPLPADDLRKLEAMTEVFPRPLQVAGKAFLKWLWR